MKSTPGSEKAICRMALCCVAVIALLGFASATENGACVYPVGVETVMTGMAPGPGGTEFYEYTAFVAANETVNTAGSKVPIEFKLRVFATAIKFSHTWDLKVLGANLDSNAAIPLVYQQLHVPTGPASTEKFSKYAIGNVALVPLSLNWHAGSAHFVLDATQIFMPGSAYSQADALNIGQHNLAYGPALSVTFLPHKGRTEISSRTTYIINGFDKQALPVAYHSGNEFMDEFAAMQMVSRKVALGVAGAYYQQTTDDRAGGLLVHGDGNRGRDLQIGPQFRLNVPHGGFAIKYFRDTLVENKARGGTLWMQVAVPFNGWNRRKEM